MPSRDSAKRLFHETDSLGLERIVFFSDAVMAIAITLLVIDIKIPDMDPAVAAYQLPAQLSTISSQLMSFFISFTVVGIYWSAHHRYFGHIKRYDSRLIALNMVFLLFIALMPFIASLLGKYGYVPLSVAIYAAEVAATGVSIGAVWWYASYQHRLVDPGLDQQYIRGRNLIAAVVPAFFLLSIPFCLVNAYAPMIVWWVSPIFALFFRRLLDKNPKRRYL
jgi:uncharacterized membrane protein